MSEQPVPPPDGPSAHHSVTELRVQIPHVLVSDMTGGAILLPHKPVQVSPIMLPQLRQDMVLEQSVVSGSCHSLIPVALQPKSAILPDTTKYGEFGGIGWPVFSETL